MRDERPGLAWQSKAILLIVVPWTAISVLLQSLFWFRQVPMVAWTTLGISAVFGLIVWRLRAGTFGAAATGAAITASLMFCSAYSGDNWFWIHGLLSPLLALFVLTFAVTKIGKSKKDRLGTGESKRGRNAAQVAANLGISALALHYSVWGIFRLHPWSGVLEFVAIAALAEAAADTVSSEIGQVFGGTPRLVTTLQPVQPGIDGGITIAGSTAGIVGAAIVSWIGFGLLSGPAMETAFLTAGCTFCATVGLLFDSVLGATLERKGYLNNDAVNFLSTLVSALFSFPLGILLIGLYLKV
jgi:uncharacterized protein (TIGR00297 family)